MLWVCVAVIQPAVAALTLLIFGDAFEQMHTAKIRPQRGSHVNFSICELPKQEVTQAHLAGSSHHQIRVGKMAGVEMASYGVLIDLQMIEAAILGGCVHDRTEGVYQFTTGAIVQRQRQHHSRVAGCGVAGPVHAMLYFCRQFVLPPDVFQANIVLVERGNFRLQIAAQQPHEEADFARRTLLPVLFGKCVERERGNTNSRRCLHRRTYSRYPGAVSSDARQVAPFGPAPVAVHDDRDVFWKPSSIETPVNFGFLAVESAGYFVLQSDASTRGYHRG